MLLISFGSLRVIDKSLYNSIPGTRSELFFEFFIFVFKRFELLFNFLKDSIKTISQTNEFGDNLIGSGIILSHNAFEEWKECLDFLNDVGFLFVSIHWILTLLIEWERNVRDVGRFIMGLVSGVLAKA